MNRGRGNIVVVGSGPAGLTAAYHLSRKGFSVRVLEAQDVIGGRVQTVVREDCLLDTGASLIPGRYKEFLSLCASLGIHDRLVPSGTVVGFHKGGTVHYMDSSKIFVDGLRSKMFGWESKFRLLSLGWDALRIFSSLRFDSIAGAAQFDTETAAAFAKRKVNPELGEHLIGNTIRSMFGNTAEDASVIDFFWGVKNFLGGKMMGMRGGNRVFIDALARHLDIATGIGVTKIEERDGGVAIHTRDKNGREGHIHADGCICATDANTAADIASHLPEDVAEYLRTYPYCASLSVHFVLSQRLDERAFVVELPISQESDMTPLVFEHNKVSDRAPPGKSLICALYGHDYSRSHFEDDEETLIQNTLASVRKYIPDIDECLVAAHASRWDRSVVKSRPGLYRDSMKLKEYRDDNRSRIQLAGDYFSISGMNSAVVSGRISAERLAYNIATIGK